MILELLAKILLAVSVAFTAYYLVQGTILVRFELATWQEIYAALNESGVINRLVILFALTIIFIILFRCYIKHYR